MYKENYISFDTTLVNIRRTNEKYTIGIIDNWFLLILLITDITLIIYF